MLRDDLHAANGMESPSKGQPIKGYNVASVNFCWPVVVLRKERFEGNAKALIS